MKTLVKPCMGKIFQSRAKHSYKNIFITAGWGALWNYWGQQPSETGYNWMSSSMVGTISITIITKYTSQMWYCKNKNNFPLFQILECFCSIHRMDVYWSHRGSFFIENKVGGVVEPSELPFLRKNERSSADSLSGKGIYQWMVYWMVNKGSISPVECIMSDKSCTDARTQARIDNRHFLRLASSFARQWASVASIDVSKGTLFYSAHHITKNLFSSWSIKEYRKNMLQV